MKNVFKVVIAAAGLFWAGSAGAVEVVDISPAQWEHVSAASSGRLAEAAQKISASVRSGDNGRAGELLAAMFSGASGNAPAAPVYASARAASAPIVARSAAAVRGGFVPELEGAAYLSKSSYEIEPEEVDGDEAGSDDDDGEEDDSADSRDDTEEASVASTSPLWETMAAGMAGILVVISFIALFPAAPLLLALGVAVLLGL